jgi:PAS domain S-box-containing protein
MKAPIKILYIDDSRTDQELVKHSFDNSPADFNIVAVSNQMDFETQLKSAEFDLVISDFNILGLSGLKIFDIVRSINESIPIVVITGTGSEEAAVELMKKGVSDYVIKTTSHIQKLPNTVLSILDNDKTKKEKILAQKELEISLQKYKVLFESFPIGITITDAEGNVLETNQKSEALLGIKKDDQISHKFNEKEWNLIHPDGSTLSIGEYAGVKSIKEKNIIENIEMGIVKDDKKTQWLNVTAAPIPLDGYGVAITYVDVTEKNEAIASLKINEERLRFTLDATTDAIWDINLQTGEAYLSSRYYTLLDYEPGDFPSTFECFQKLIHPDDADILNKVMDDYFKNTRNIHSIELRMKSKKDEWKWILSRGKTIGRNNEGKPLRMVGTNTDITERKRIEEDLKRKNRALRILSECNISLVKINNEKELATDICSKINTIGGYQLVWIGLINQDDKKSIIPLAWSGKESDKEEFMDIQLMENNPYTSSIEKAFESQVFSLIRNIRADLNCRSWLNYAAQKGYNSVLSLPLIINNKVIGVLTIYSYELNGFDEEEIALLSELANDIAYGIIAIRTREEHSKLENQLLQSQKNEAIGRLAGGIAHDFNNILTVIMGNAEILSFPQHDQNQFLGHIEQIKSAAEKASSLTRQLLAFSRKEIIQPKIINPNEMVKEMQKMLQRLIGEDIDLKVILDPLVSNIIADQSHLDQVIMNLVVNAKDAMPEGGDLTIQTKNLLIEEKNIYCFPKAKPGKYVVLEVKDTGIGINDEIISKIFDPFFTTKEVGKGTGLGLSVVEGIVNQNQGWIDVSSEVGKGTTFKIYFPVIEKTVSEDKKTINILNLAQGNGEKILVLEDEHNIRELAKSTLTMRGYDVFEAMNIASAFRILEVEAGKFDLIFSDIILPDGSGIDFYEEAILKYPDLKVLFTSGYADEKGKWEKIQKNNYKFIQKPYKILELLSEIKKQLS